jgi:hypothetical protein
VPIRQTFLRLGEGVSIPFGELIAQRLDLRLIAMEIHLVRLDLRFRVLDLDRPGL